MRVTDFLPFQQARRGRPRKAQLVDTNDQRTISRLFRAVGLAIGFLGGSATTYSRSNFECAPYDFDRIIQAIDSDAYVKQAFNKYRELLWKEGWVITSENTEALEYLYQRIDFLELAMDKSFLDFLVEAADQLVKFANVFIVKVRGPLGPHFPGTLKPPRDEEPIIGYQVLPAETMEIERDYRNNVLKYRQNVWGDNPLPTGMSDSDAIKLMPTWKPDEVIHLTFDRKPGYAFGTPFFIASIDDVVALRQIEEDIQNLIHRELFPLYKFKVGTDDFPAEDEEIEQAAAEISAMRTEGALILSERRDVEVVGAEGNALDADPYLAHFKERVAIGVGLAPHHLGMLMNGGNRSVTDRLDVALYDKIKTYQRYLANSIRLYIFNELLLEGGFDPFVSPTGEDVSDRCLFVFNEIDVDTKVKKENHTLQKWTSDLLESDEARIEIGEKPELDESKTYTAQQQRALPSPAPPVRPGQGSSSTTPTPALPSSGGVNNAPRKPDAAKPSTGGSPNAPNAVKKQVGNKSQPSNQFTRRLSPNIRHSWVESAVDLLGEDDRMD